MEEANELPESVRFYLRPVVDAEATLAAGCTKHKDAVYVEISTPGERSNIVDRPAKEMHKQRYPRAWAAFQSDKTHGTASGTLLSVWGALPLSVVADYSFHKIQTVEQLASVSDASLPNMGPGARSHRDQAKNFIEAAKGNSPLLKLEKEKAEMAAEVAALKQALKEQGDRLDILAKAKGK